MNTLLSSEEKFARFQTFLRVLKETNNASKAGQEARVDKMITLKLLEFGVITKKGHARATQWSVVDGVDVSTLWDVAQQILPNFEGIRGPQKKGKERLAHILGAPAVGSPSYPPVGVAEEISKHLAVIAQLLGVQFGQKTPPGLYQMFLSRENEVKTLREENKELKKKFNSLAKMIGRRLPDEEVE